MEQYESQERLQQFLDAGQVLRWSGQPEQGYRFQSTDWFLIPFGLFFLGFSLIWVFAAMLGAMEEGGSGPVLLFPLFGLPFVLVGIWFVFGRFIYDRWVRANTYYGVTDEEILILRDTFSTTVTRHDIRSLPRFTVEERGDGTGTIRFEIDSSPFGQMKQFQRNVFPFMTQDDGQLVEIPQVRRVAKLIRERRDDGRDDR